MADSLAFFQHVVMPSLDVLFYCSYSKTAITFISIHQSWLSTAEIVIALSIL